MEYYNWFYYLIISYSIINIVLSYKNIESSIVRNIIVYNAIFMLLATVFMSFAHGIYIDEINLNGDELWLGALTSVIFLMIIHFVLIFSHDRKKQSSERA